MNDLNNIKFWHKVRLKDGGFTNGSIDVENCQKHILFDELEFQNKSVLDVGCWDGYFSFEAEKKGASRVVSLDDLSCRWGGIDGYNFLHDHFNSKATFVHGNVYNLKSAFKYQEFDIVLCYGVLYHLSDPLLALQQLFYTCKTTIHFEGIFSTLELPHLEFIPNKQLNRDSSNIYIPSISYMKLIAGYNGFVIRKISTPVWRRFSLIFDRASNGDEETTFPPTVFPR
jgi:tRNA (mo5U34)-methyltransferase